MAVMRTDPVTADAMSCQKRPLYLHETKGADPTDRHVVIVAGPSKPYWHLVGQTSSTQVKWARTRVQETVQHLGDAQNSITIRVVVVTACVRTHRGRSST